jgi:hypothetical protein
MPSNSPFFRKRGGGRSTGAGDLSVFVFQGFLCQKQGLLPYFFYALPLFCFHAFRLI